MTGLRRFPYPYRAMLAVCSDVDATAPWEFLRIHRFLNTLTPRLPYYGDGLGLDIGDSFFFKNISNNGLNVYDPCYRYRDENAWTRECGLRPRLDPVFHRMPFVNGFRTIFGRDIGWIKDPRSARDPGTGRLVFEGGPNFIEKYIRCGWIDVLHGGDGNWAEVAVKSGASDWRRTDGQHYLEWMAARELQIDTFTNHSRVSSAFGFSDEPSTPTKSRLQGDLPGSPAYWADYARRAGIKFFWCYIPTERAAFRHTFGVPSLLAAAAFRDGGKFWHFTRYDVGRPFADTIHSLLNGPNLDRLVRDRNFEIAYTHFGYWSDNSNRVNPELSQSSIDALRLLKTYQDDGLILVAKTSRLLRYNLALDHLAFTAVEKYEGAVIDLESIKDTQFGDFTPALRDVRGITFYVPDSSKAEIRIAGSRVPEEEIRRNPADESGWQSIAIKWFEPDYTDYTIS